MCLQSIAQWSFQNPKSKFRIPEFVPAKYKLIIFFKFCHNNWNAFVSGSRSRERNRDRDRRSDRDKDRGDRRKSSNNKSSSSPIKKTDKKQRDEEREFEALREKYKLKEFPDSWKRLKKVEKLDLKSPDFVKLKRAFQKPTRYVILNI